MAVPQNDEDDFEGDPDEDDGPESAPAPVAAPQQRRKKRAVGAGQVRPSVSQWKNREADLMWGEMLDKMKSEGRTPFEMYIAVVDTTGANRGTRLCSFDASSVDGASGNPPPGEALICKVEDFHMQSGAQGNGNYEIQFIWKNNSHPWGKGNIVIKPPAVIRNMRALQDQMNGEPAAQPGPPQGMGRPPMQQPAHGQPPQWQGSYYPPQYYQPPQGYQQGYPPPPQSQQDVEMAEMRAQLTRERETNARNQGMLEELIRAQREGRAPNVPPPAVGAGAPPPPPAAAVVDTATIVKQVLESVLPVLGIGRPAAVPQATAEDRLMKVMNEGMSAIISQTMNQVMTGMKRSITGLGGPLETHEAEIVPEEKPEDALPFIPSNLEQTWADGRKVGIAINKESGKIDWMGTAVANPFLAEKVADLGQKLGEAFADGVKKINAGGPHIVHHTPSGAKPADPLPPPPQNHGSGFGGGWE
jgi:hypothetical protein